MYVHVHVHVRTSMCSITAVLELMFGERTISGQLLLKIQEDSPIPIQGLHMCSIADVFAVPIHYSTGSQSNTCT